MTDQVRPDEIERLKTDRKLTWKQLAFDLETSIRRIRLWRKRRRIPKKYVARLRQLIDGAPLGWGKALARLT